MLPPATEAGSAAGNRRYSCEGGHLMHSDLAPSSQPLPSQSASREPTSAGIASSDAITSSFPETSGTGAPPPSNLAATRDDTLEHDDVKLVLSLPADVMSSSAAAADPGLPPPSGAAAQGAGENMSSSGAQDTAESGSPEADRMTSSPETAAEVPGSPGALITSQKFDRNNVNYQQAPNA